jgi:glycosyltransferase involved in cell wall biosynthesis
MPITRYAGLTGDRIAAISDRPFSDAVEVPSELDAVSSNDLVQQFSYRDGKFQSKTTKKPIKDIRLAIISNWDEKCGISTYAQYLYAHITDKVADYKIFAENTLLNTNQFSHSGTDANRIVHCWKRGESLQQLVVEIKKFNPDIISIQHEFGLWPSARYWLSFLTQLSDYRIITTLHSVFPTHIDKAVFEGAMQEIVVHSIAAKKALQENKQLSARIEVIPHGTFPCTDTFRLWNNYKSEHTLCSFGFLFRYKAVENTIRAVAILKAKYPDVFFTCLCSGGDFSQADHNAYWRELMALVEKLGLQEQVALLRGFFSDTVIDAYMRSNKVAVFPYQSNEEHKCFGSSGAGREAMSYALPVITSNAPHFTDLPTIKVDTPEEMAVELSKLFEDPAHAKTQVEKQNVYLAENSWEKTAERYLRVFES